MHTTGYATDAAAQIDPHTPITKDIHAALSNAIELAEQVKAFRATMLGSSPEESSSKTGPIAVRAVVDDLRDHVYSTNRIIRDAMDALAAVERELN